MSNDKVTTELTAAEASHIAGIVIKGVIPFLKGRVFAFLVSGGIMVGGIVGGILHGGFDLGIDFKGGVKVEVQITKPNVDEKAIRKVFSDAKVEADVNTVGSPADQHFMVTLPIAAGSNGAEVEKVSGYLESALGKEQVVIKGSELVEAKMGADFAARAVQLLLIVTALIVIYVVFRFDFYYSVGALVATVHDVALMLAFAIFFRIPIDMTIIAAVLTIMGYSINDTIVVYDRIRELVKNNKEEDLEYVMDKSITQTLSRTIITVLTVIFVAVAIYIWGGIVLHNFAFLLLIGLISGTYSSIFISAPIVYITKRIFDKNYKGKKKLPANA